MSDRKLAQIKAELDALVKTIEHLNQRRIRLEEEYSTGFKRAQADFAEWGRGIVDYQAGEE